MKIKKAKKLAKKYSSDPNIRYAGIVKNFASSRMGWGKYCVVLTKECVIYQINQKEIIRWYFLGKKQKLPA